MRRFYSKRGINLFYFKLNLLILNLIFPQTFKDAQIGRDVSEMIFIDTFNFIKINMKFLEK